MIRAQLMVELGYEAAARREIAILRLLHQPGVARLVSSFRLGLGVGLGLGLGLGLG